MVLQISNLSKNFGDINALNGISITIEPGSIVGLLGPNGSGKTTLIKIIAGLISTYDGNITLFNKNIGYETKGMVSYLPDIDFIPPSWSVYRSVEYFSDFFDDFDKTQAISLLKDLQIPQNVVFKSLSKGTREKLQLVLTLSRKAKLYIFDEPIAGVDPVARDTIFELIMDNYNKSGSIIFSTHLIANVESILSHVIFIKLGEIVEQGSIESIKDKFNNYPLENIFKELF